MLFDLHSHSQASDGDLSPTELVERAVSSGVDVLALTDHDVTDGLEEAKIAAKVAGLSLVNGVEISVSWKTSTIHVLGLNINYDNELLQKGLSKLREFRVWRGEEIANRLAKKGIKNALQGAQAYAGGSILSRTHFAHFLVEQGYAKNTRDVFKHFLVNNKPGYVPGNWAEMQQAVDWIKAAGGIAVIAHPARYRLSKTKLRLLLEYFIACGGKGLEVVSSSHNEQECRQMAKLAERYQLVASCGSDFHGPQQVWAQLGKIPSLPLGCVPVWEQWNLAELQ